MRSASTITEVAIALGSNLGDRAYNLRRAMHLMRDAIRIVRVSPIYETAAVGAPPGSPPFFNMAVTGYTALDAKSVMRVLLDIEAGMGRIRRGPRNAPRTIDLDLIAYGAGRMRTPMLTVPHPRAAGRDFVLLPLIDCSPSIARFVSREIGR